MKWREDISDGNSVILRKNPRAPLQVLNLRQPSDDYSGSDAQALSYKSQAMIHDFDGVSVILWKNPSAPL